MKAPKWLSEHSLSIVTDVPALLGVLATLFMEEGSWLYDTIQGLSHDLFGVFAIVFLSKFLRERGALRANRPIGLSCRRMIVGNGLPLKTRNTPHIVGTTLPRTASS